MRAGIVMSLLGVWVALTSADAALVSYWAMDEGSGATTANAVAGAPDGTLTNPAANNWIAGHDGTGYALDFNGTNQRLECSTNATLDAMDEKISLGTWFKSDFSGAWFRAMAAKFGDSGISNFWGLGWMSTNKLGFYVRDTGGVSNQAAAPTGWGLDDQWHHLLGIRDKGGSNKVYLFGDGDLLAETTSTAGNVSNTRPFMAASHYGGSYVREAIDDLAIWNEALNPYQVRALARGQVTPSDANAYSNAILDDNPVAYWRLEESLTASQLAADSTGNGHTATFSGAVETSTRALNFDGLNRYARLDSTSDFIVSNSTISGSEFGPGGEYSIELWFNADQRHQGDLLALTDDGNGDSHVVLLETESNGTIRYLHRVPSGNSGGSNIYAGSYDEDTWHFLTAVKTATEMLLYLDGVEVGSTSNTNAVPSAYDLNVVLGRIQPGNSVRSFQGGIDEVALFGYALTAEQVWAHYVAAVPEPSALATLGSLAGFGLVGGLLRRRR